MSTDILLDVIDRLVIETSNGSLYSQLVITRKKDVHQHPEDRSKSEAVVGFSMDR
jgi:hypothetical protein